MHINIYMCVYIYINYSKIIAGYNFQYLGNILSYMIFQMFKIEYYFKRNVIYNKEIICIRKKNHICNTRTSKWWVKKFIIDDKILLRKRSLENKKLFSFSFLPLSMLKSVASYRKIRHVYHRSSCV